MKILIALFIVLTALSFPLWASGQTASSLESQSQQDQKIFEAMNSVEKYCWDVERFSDSHQARLFAEIGSGKGEAKWVEFASKIAWRDAGQPEPVALVWYRNSRVVQVAAAFHNEDDNGWDHASYCYDPDGKLARLATAPKARAACDEAYFRCQLTSGIDRLYLPDGRKVQIVKQFDPRPLKSEQTVFATSNATPPEYLKVTELPFAHLLR